MKNNSIGSLAIILIFIFLAAPTHAQLPSLNYVQTNRSVEYLRLVDTTPSNFYDDASVTINELDDSNSLGFFSATIDGADFQGTDPYIPIFEPALTPAASQTSTIGFNSVVGSGFSDTFFVFDPGALINVTDLGNSSLSVVFDLSGPTNYSLDASVTGSSQVSLFGGPSDPINGNLIASVFDGQLNQAGVLAPGQYTLQAGIEFFPDPFISGPGTFDLDFQVDVVPEPSSICCLLIAAFAGVASRRRSA